MLLLDGQLDTPLVQMLEQKFEKCRFVRVDGDTIERLIAKDNAEEQKLSDDEREKLAAVFNAELPKLDKTEFHVETSSMGEGSAPIVITQSEYMRRMKEVSRLQPGMAFYGEMPDMYNVVLNADHRLVKKVLEGVAEKLGSQLEPIDNELRGLHARHDALEQKLKDKKPEEITEEEKTEREACHKDIEAQETKKRELLAGYAKDTPVVSQLIDLALLQNGLLKGEALAKFLKRSVELL